MPESLAPLAWGGRLVERAQGATVARADLHLGISRDGEIFVTSRQDGTIRMLVPDSAGGTASAR